MRRDTLFQKTRMLKPIFFPFYFEVGLGISRTNADSQWNPIYKVFHRIHRCGNETIRR